MIGEPARSTAVHAPPWDLFDDPTASISPAFSLSGVSVNSNGGGGGGEYSPLMVGEALAALQRYLPSNEIGRVESEEEFMEVPLDAFSCDNFRMFEFKVRRCSRGRSHDWTECPYAHPGEKACRRDPRKYHYSGTACPEFRKGACRKGDACEFAHGVFECWLHPARYRTQACKDGTHCRRRVCFFAHTPEQLRVLPHQTPRGSPQADSYDGSPRRHAFNSYLSKGSSVVSSPTSILTSPPVSPPSESPPMSPNGGCSVAVSRNYVGELVASMRGLQIGNKLSPPPTWGGVSGFGSPRCSILRPGCYSLPTTPTRAPVGSGLWDAACCEEEPAMERVESGRDLRAKIYARLSKQNSLDRGYPTGPDPDVGWVSELVNMG